MEIVTIIREIIVIRQLVSFISFKSVNLKIARGKTMC